MDNMTQNPGTVPEEQNAGDQQDQQNNERTFSQEEVNEIVQKRLAKERERLSKVFQEEKQLSELEEREQNILKRELKADAIEALSKRGFPARLADLLDYSSEENLESSLNEVTEIFSAALGERLKPFARQKTPLEGIAGNSLRPNPLRKAFDL